MQQTRTRYIISFDSGGRHFVPCHPLIMKLLQLLHLLQHIRSRLPLQDLMDVSTEIARLEKELQRLDAELARSAKMLGNERFLAKAPKAKIEEETLKQQNYRQQRQATADMLEQMKKLQ